MIKGKSTSLDFGKMDREPIDLLIGNGCEFESVQVDANSEEQGIAVVKDADVLVVGLQRSQNGCSMPPDGSRSSGGAASGLTTST